MMAGWKAEGFGLAGRADDAYPLDTRRNRDAASTDPVRFTLDITFLGGLLDYGPDEHSRSALPRESLVAARVTPLGASATLRSAESCARKAVLAET